MLTLIRRISCDFCNAQVENESTSYQDSWRSNPDDMLLAKASMKGWIYAKAKHGYDTRPSHLCPACAAERLPAVALKTKQMVDRLKDLERGNEELKHVYENALITWNSIVACNSKVNWPTLVDVVERDVLFHWSDEMVNFSICIDTYEAVWKDKVDKWKKTRDVGYIPRKARGAFDRAYGHDR